MFPSDQEKVFKLLERLVVATESISVCVNQLARVLGDDEIQVRVVKPKPKPKPYDRDDPRF